MERYFTPKHGIQGVLILQNVLTNEYLYPYPQLYDQQSNEYYKDPISVQNLRYKNKEPAQPEANPIKVRYDAVVDEVQTKYLNSPKQVYKKDRYKPLDAKMQKLKLIIGDPKTSKKKIILSGEIVKTYNTYKDVEHNDYEPNAYIERLMEIYSDHRTPKKYKNIYLEIICTYYRNRDLLERTHINVNILGDDSNNIFDSEKYNCNPYSEEYESEKDLNDYDIDMLSKRNPGTFVKWLEAWLSKIGNSSTTTPVLPNLKLSQFPQTRDTGKQLFIAPTKQLPFTDNLKETETLINITQVLQNLNLNIEKQNELVHMNTDRKGHIRFKRDLNSEKNVAKESTVTNSSSKTNGTEGISKKCNCSEDEDGRRVYGRTDGQEQMMDNERPPIQIKTLSHIDSTYAIIEQKILPLSKIKETYSTNNTYKVGYIIATIDTLVSNIKRLKGDMDWNNKWGKKWDDSATFDLFDKVMTGNKIIANLMAKLKLYTEN